MKNIVISLSLLLLIGCSTPPPQTYVPPQRFINPKTGETLIADMGHLVVEMRGHPEQPVNFGCEGKIYGDESGLTGKSLIGTFSWYRSYYKPIQTGHYTIDIKFNCNVTGGPTAIKGRKKIPFNGKAGRINMVTIELIDNQYKIFTESIDDPELTDEILNMFR